MNDLGLAGPELSSPPRWILFLLSVSFFIILFVVFLKHVSHFEQLCSRFLERCSLMSKAMLPDAKSYAFGHQKLYFQTSKAMLSDAKSYAHGLQKLCLRPTRAMLCTFKSYVPQHSKICFSCYPHGVAFSVVVDLCSRQACSSGVARQFRARFQAELLHLDRSFGRADLPSPLPSFAVQSY